jgi:hypothetical protein
MKDGAILHNGTNIALVTKNLRFLSNYPTMTMKTTVFTTNLLRHAGLDPASRSESDFGASSGIRSSLQAL